MFSKTASRKPSLFASLRRRSDADLAAAIELRQATRADIPAIDAMHFLSVQALGADDYGPAEIEAILGEFGTYDPGLIDDGTYYVLIHAGHVVGSGGWSLRLPHGGLPQTGADVGDAVEDRHYMLSPSSGKIRAIFVHPNYARLGLGARLVRHAEAEAAARGHQLFELWATLTGVPLYERLGYQDLGRVNVHCSNGAAITMVHMAKLMPAAGQASAA